MLNKFDVLKIFSLAKIESLSVCNVLMTFIFIPIQLLPGKACSYENKECRSAYTDDFHKYNK